MRRMTWGFCGLTALLLAVTGCTTARNQIKPPTVPEEFASPPADDPRYSNPPKYPRDTLNQGLIRRSEGPNALGRPNFQRPGGRYGGGY